MYTTLLKDLVDAVKEGVRFGERIVDALETIAAPKRTLSIDELSAFATLYDGGRLAGEAKTLWLILTCAELRFRLETVGLESLGEGRRINIGPLKEFASSPHAARGFVTGLNGRRVELLGRWVASL